MGKGKNSHSSIFRNTEFSLIIIIAVIFIVASIGTQNFMTEYNLTNLLKQCAITGVLALSATYVIIAGGIDLSCGSVCGFATLIVAMGQARWGLPVWLTIVLALLIGIACGLVNAFIIHEFSVPPFIATLGTMTIIRGMIKVIGNASTISGINTKFADFAATNVPGIHLPKLALVWIGMGVLTWLLLRYTTFGRNMFVLGSGADVARLSGVSIRKTTYKTYAFAGLLCGIAGIMLCARINSSVPTAGEGYEMNAIAAAVIGGASMAGAKGSIVGTMLGIILMVMIQNAGIQFGINSFIMEITTGILITLAVLIDQLKNRGTGKSFLARILKRPNK
ncbi:MAG: ABC transporter permease [Eubacterium sp.]|nr:ABC transporter permease [Eubacterium sp.]